MFTNCGLQLNPSENSFHILLWNLPSSSCSQFPGFSCRSFIPSFRHLYKKLCCGWCCWQNLLFSVQWLGFVSWKFRKTTWKDKAALLFCEENKQRLFIIPTGSAPSPDDKLCRHTASPLMRNHLLGKRVCMSNVWSTAGFLQVRDWPGQTPPVCVEAAGRWNKQPLLLLPLDKGKQFCTPPFYFSDFDKAVNKRNKAGIRNAPNPPLSNGGRKHCRLLSAVLPVSVTALPFAWWETDEPWHRGWMVEVMDGSKFLRWKPNPQPEHICGPENKDERVHLHFREHLLLSSELR